MKTFLLESNERSRIRMFASSEESIQKKIRAVMEAFETISYTCVVDEKARVFRMNDRFAALIGVGDDETTISLIPFLKRARLSRVAVHALKRLQRNEPFRQELSLHEIGQTPCWFDIHVVPRHDEMGALVGAVAILLDITERKQAEEAMAFHAYHDTLTGLPNRRLLVERLQQARLRAERLGEKFAVLFLDLDRFKEVNDTYGHRTGDAVLVEAARRIQSVLRRDDTVCRQGGDEFIVVLPGLQQSAAATGVARKLIETLARPILIDGTVCSIGASIGISIFPDNDRRPDRLIQLADRALYRAKDAGKGRFVFADDVSSVSVPASSDSEDTKPNISDVCQECPVRQRAGVGMIAASRSLLDG